MPEHKPRTTEAAAAAQKMDERLERLEFLAAALAAEIDLLRSEREVQRPEDDEAREAAEEHRVRPGAQELRAVEAEHESDSGLARVAALELVAEGLNREAVTAELERLGISDPEPVVSDAFRHAKAS